MMADRSDGHDWPTDGCRADTRRYTLEEHAGDPLMTLRQWLGRPCRLTGI
jgi:hypothetical protein